jgi:dTDP-4-dehydrorhamnose 3,5-epimerase-like enzyme
MKFKVIKFDKYINPTGCLIPFYRKQSFKNFKILRFFFLYGKFKSFRANHAHKKCNQIYIPVAGKILVEITNKKNNTKKILLGYKNNKFIIIPKMTWTKITFLEKKSILLVLCDYKYDRNEYIENKQKFLEI